MIKDTSDNLNYTQNDNRFINHDIALNRLQEAMMKSNPAAYLNKEYKYNLDEAFNDRIKEVKQQIKSLPSKYFETKFRRPVYLNEFAAAVVPNDLPQDLKERLQQSGLPLFEYDPNKEGDRRAVTLEATEGDGIRFSVANRNQAIFVSNAARAVEGIKQVDVAGTAVEYGDGKFLPVFHIDAGRFLIGIASVFELKFFHF
jgi:hypothetical protein